MYNFPFLSFASHTHPDPNNEVAAVVNSFLKLSNEPHSFSMAESSAPDGVCSAFGEKELK